LNYNAHCENLPPNFRFELNGLKFNYNYLALLLAIVEFAYSNKSNKFNLTSDELLTELNVPNDEHYQKILNTDLELLNTKNIFIGGDGDYFDGTLINCKNINNSKTDWEISLIPEFVKLIDWGIIAKFEYEVFDYHPEISGRSISFRDAIKSIFKTV